VLPPNPVWRSTSVLVCQHYFIQKLVQRSVLCRFAYLFLIKCL